MKKKEVYKKNQFPKTNTPKINRYFLSDFLPYDPEKKFGSALKTGLNEYFFLICGALKTIESFEINDLEQFDALVGENACQIRAVWISIIASKKQIFLQELRRNIEESEDKIQKLLEEKTIQKLMRSGISLKKLLAKEKTSVFLDKEEAFILSCFFLKESKVSTSKQTLQEELLIKEKCDPKRLKKFGSISSSFADNLVSKLRKFVAGQSVQFVRNHAKKQNDKKLIKMLSDEFTIKHNNHLSCTPMFWTYKAVLFAARKAGVKLILNVKLLKKKESHFELFDEYVFESVLEGSELTIKTIDWDNLEDTPCIVFQGVSCSDDTTFFSKNGWESNPFGFPVETIILAGAADHRQYPNEVASNRLSQLLQDHELETFKSFAKEEGFSIENPTKFFIQHVYAASTEALKLKFVMPTV